MSVCSTGVTELGVIRDLLGAVDCNVNLYMVSGYQALTAPGSMLPQALTALLTIYVAILGYRLLFAIGAPKLSEAPLIAIEVGAVLALTLNWGAFQTLVFNVTSQAPMEIAKVISKPMAQDGGLGADPLATLQAAYDELIQDGQDFGRRAGPSALASRGGDAAAADTLWQSANALLASTAGVLAVATIATGVLTAVGPIFVTLFLFEATRGFFIGWVRALVASMLAPMVCWITTSLLLLILQPWIEALRDQRQSAHLSPDTAASASAIVLVFAAAQGILILAGLLVAAGFQSGRRAASVEVTAAPAAGPQATVERLELMSRTEALTRSLRQVSSSDRREVVVSQESARNGEGGVEVGGGDMASRRPTRLGETYRRGPAMRDRGRASLAGRS
jgi:type IV secretion system protein VirB6